MRYCYHFVFVVCCSILQLLTFQCISQNLLAIATKLATRVFFNFLFDFCYISRSNMAARTNYTFSLAESSKLFFPETTREIEMLLGRNIPLKSLWVFFCCRFNSQNRSGCRTIKSLNSTLCRK